MLENSQVDYILIWGHGLVYKDNIIDVIEAQANLKILKILFYKPRKISDLVKTIYSYDYAPFRHLKEKTRYLKSTPNKTLFIFVDNIKPDNDYLGEGRFRHLESMTLKALKEEIRNAYNPCCNGKRTEEHVIHISDNEMQTDYILKYLEYDDGVNSILPRTGLVTMPHHVHENRHNKSCFQLKRVRTTNIYCSILYGTPDNASIKTVPIIETPHFKSLISDSKAYEDYLKMFQGYYLLDYYSMAKFLTLEKEMQYLQGKYSSDYIIVRQMNDKYIIQDGVHRASILAKKNHEQITVAIIE